MLANISIFIGNLMQITKIKISMRQLNKQDYQNYKMHLGSHSSNLHYPPSKSPRPNSKNYNKLDNNQQLFPSQYVASSSSSLPTNPQKQESTPKIVIVPSERAGQNRVGKLADSHQKIHLNKSANKQADHLYMSHAQKNTCFEKNSLLNPKDSLPPKPRKFSDSNANLTHIMEKLQKKEEIIQEIKKIAENKVSDIIRKPSLDKFKNSAKNEQNIQKNSGSIKKNESSLENKPQKMTLEVPVSPSFKPTKNLTTLESTSKSESKQQYLVVVNKNPEQNNLGGRQRTQYIWSRQPQYQNQLTKQNSRSKKSIERVSSRVEISTQETNENRTARVNSYNFSNTFTSGLLSHKNSTQNRKPNNLQVKQPQYTSKNLSSSCQIKQKINKPAVFSNKKVSIHDFSLKKTLGEGRFGVVYQAFHIQTSSLYALKKISKQVIKTNLMVDQLLQEIKIQLYCSHQNILKIYGFFDDSQFIYLILQYMQQGTLFSLFKKQKTLAEKEASEKLSQIAAGIVYLQSNGIAHRDIKPENIVISNGVGKLCDFGWAAICTDRRKTYCGTFDYVAPQILQGGQYDQTVDLWCLGVMAYELMVGKAPFYHISRKQTMNKIMNVQNRPLEYPSHLSKNAISFIDSLVRKNPEQRLNGQGILKHPFFTEKIDLIEKRKQ